LELATKAGSGRRQPRGAAGIWNFVLAGTDFCGYEQLVIQLRYGWLNRFLAAKQKIF